MNARNSDRIITNLSAEIVVGSNHYAGTIENLSGEGAYILTASSRNAADFRPDTELELTFKLPDGGKHTLRCIIKWSYLTPPHGFTNSIGLEIVDPPTAYHESIGKMR